jgi:hypothetical protein
MRKDVRTIHDSVTCAVCGRTLLRGEHAEVYLEGGERRQVCELCTARATHQGWIRENASLEVGARGRDRFERRPLRGRLLARRARTRSPEAPAEAALDQPLVPDGAFAPQYDPDHRVHAIPTNGELKAGRAVDLFNASEHPRTVAGVARSLGLPTVTVRPNDEPSLVTIVVAWELCWYRYDIDLADGAGGVRVAGQGYELAELAAEDQAANAAADEHGALALASA